MVRLKYAAQGRGSPASGFELLCFRDLFATQNAFSAHIFAIAGTSILWTKQIPEKITGRTSDQDEKAS
jgi:hypothetical protein